MMAVSVESNRIPFHGFTKRGQSNNGGKAAPVYICLGDSKGHHSKYQKGDLWAVCSSSSFNPQLPGEVLFIAKSVMHGPSSAGQLEVCLSSLLFCLCTAFLTWALSHLQIEILDQNIRLLDTQTMHCINCGNFSTELSVIGTNSFSSFTFV